MAVDFQDAIETVRQLTEAVARLGRTADQESLAVEAFEAGNRFLTNAGHEPVDEANLPDGDEDDQD